MARAGGSSAVRNARKMEAHVPILPTGFPTAIQSGALKPGDLFYATDGSDSDLLLMTDSEAGDPLCVALWSSNPEYHPQMPAVATLSAVGSRILRIDEGLQIEPAGPGKPYAPSSKRQPARYGSIAVAPGVGCFLVANNWKQGLLHVVVVNGAILQRPIDATHFNSWKIVRRAGEMETVLVEYEEGKLKA